METGVYSKKWDPVSVGVIERQNGKRVAFVPGCDAAQSPPIIPVQWQVVCQDNVDRNRIEIGEVQVA